VKSPPKNEDKLEDYEDIQFWLNF